MASSLNTQGKPEELAASASEAEVQAPGSVPADEVALKHLDEPGGRGRGHGRHGGRGGRGGHHREVGVGGSEELEGSDEVERGAGGLQGARGGPEGRSGGRGGRGQHHGRHGHHGEHDGDEGHGHRGGRDGRGGRGRHGGRHQGEHSKEGDIPEPPSIDGAPSPYAGEEAHGDVEGKPSLGEAIVQQAEHMHTTEENVDEANK